MKIKILNQYATVPKYNRDGDAGFDLSAAEDIIIMPGETVTIATGLAFGISANNEVQIRPRSGLSLKSKLRVILGTIDSNYTGEIKVIAENVGHSPIYVYMGDRIAQAVLCPVAKAEFEIVDELEDTIRGNKGFGSSGV